MNDQSIMENILLTTKGVCDLYMHGAIESATQNVQNTFDTALNDSLCMQSDIYQKMSQKGWYPAQKADQQQIDQVRQKYANKCC
jgi:spore coat protein CotF